MSTQLSAACPGLVRPSRTDPRRRLATDPPISGESDDDHGELRPDEAADPAEFIEMLRQLKDRSQLTYRQLEQRAAAGDVLARSTAAGILRRSTLPRPEVVAAFVRACGAEDQVETWLQARHRLAVGAYAPTGSDQQQSATTTSDEPPGSTTADVHPSTAPVLERETRSGRVGSPGVRRSRSSSSGPCWQCSVWASGSSDPTTNRTPASAAPRPARRPTFPRPPRTSTPARRSGRTHV
ncbi:helix-turn-helix domain-containing protein [Micromonospora sp. M12]